ncbi:MAG TPA: FxsA family protein [Acidimicrobiales bacterium]|nr:FxsA family protein [Acidimicrobiales bacterium]
MGLLFLLFVVVPILELVVIIQVGQSLGAWNTAGVLVVDSLAGAWLVKHQGLGLIRKSRERIRNGEMPGSEISAGIAVLFAGALMLTPGFVTDAVGLMLLIPPIRNLLTSSIRRRFHSRLSTNFASQDLPSWNPIDPTEGGYPPKEEDQ